MLGAALLISGLQAASSPLNRYGWLPQAKACAGSPFRGIQNATYCDGNCEDLILFKVPPSRIEIAGEFQLKCFIVLGKFKFSLSKNLV
jgi:hypothetical protein